MQTITPVQGTHIRHGMLIRLTVDTTDYFISNLYGPITYQGNSYTQLGHFLALNEMQNDLKITNNQITVTLSGIPPSDGGDINYMGIVLNSRIKGSQIEISRVFFDTSTGAYIPSQVYLRFKGYVSNYSVSENWDQDGKLVSNTVGILCSSINAIMERKYAGRRTNDQDQKKYFAGDTGMYRVKELSDTEFDFGKPYTPTGGGNTGGGSYEGPLESTGP